MADVQIEDGIIKVVQLDIQDPESRGGARGVSSGAMARNY